VKSYKQLIEKLHESIILTDNNNEIFYYNETASQIFGFEYSTKKEDQDIPLTIQNIDIDLTNILFKASQHNHSNENIANEVSDMIREMK